MHGDAALSGQGVIQETLALSAVPHFNIGGSLHVAINNQVCIVYQCNYFVCLHHIFLLFFFLDATCSACRLSLGFVSHTAHYWCWQILFIVVAVMHDSYLVSPVSNHHKLYCTLLVPMLLLLTPYQSTSPTKRWLHTLPQPHRLATPPLGSGHGQQGTALTWPRCAVCRSSMLMGMTQRCVQQQLCGWSTML